jgi:hypothetical protein
VFGFLARRLGDDHACRRYYANTLASQLPYFLLDIELPLAGHAYFRWAKAWMYEVKGFPGVAIANSIPTLFAAILV